MRFNLRRGGSASVEELELLARRVYATAGWHVELYVDSRELAELFDRLVGLPAVAIDHLGLSRSGFPMLIQLVERGVYVKVKIRRFDVLGRLVRAGRSLVFATADLHDESGQLCARCDGIVAVAGEPAAEAEERIAL